MDILSVFRRIVKAYFQSRAANNYFSYYKSIDKACSDSGSLFVSDKPDSVSLQEWLDYWRRYYPKVKPDGFRIFSRYMGKRLDIVPLEFVAAKVEPILTPTKLLLYYSDKNNFGKILPKQFMPKVYLRNIGGYYFDDEYSSMSSPKVSENFFDCFDDVTKLVVKPTKLSSGCGIQIFDRQGKIFVNKNQDKLTFDYLTKEYGVDWLIQEYVQQSDFCAQFNPTSVNTIRIATYRDIDGEVHALSSVFRIGALGAEVDNAHLGGKFCGITEDGKLGKYVGDFLGRVQNEFNGIDFSNEDYKLPNYNLIRQFAVEVSKNIIHHDLVALDIALDKNNEPILLELNVGGFGAWVFQMCGDSVFGKYTEEICERCTKAYDKLQYAVVPTGYTEESYCRK